MSLGGTYRYVRHADVEAHLAAGWMFAADLGPTHGAWSVLMRACYCHEESEPMNVPVPPPPASSPRVRDPEAEIERIRAWIRCALSALETEPEPSLAAATAIGALLCALDRKESV